MSEETSGSPSRLGLVEMDVHTVKFRLSILEDAHRDTPNRLTKVEIAVERLPKIDNRLAQLEDQVAKGFNKVLGAVGGAGFILGLIEFGPTLLKMLGSG